MPAATAVDPLLDGRDALDTSRWDDARAAFEDGARRAARRPTRATASARRCGSSSHVEEGIAARERAFEGYVRERRCDEAARVAVWVSHQYFISGRASAARGWLARAERAVEGAGAVRRPRLGRGRARAARARASRSASTHARRALQIAREWGAADLEVFALSLLGRAEVSAGRREAGMALLEEAMAAASAGRVRNVHTLGEAYCNLIMASTNAGDWERAAEWCELVDDFAREHEVTPLLGACRTAHADVLLATGRWAEAERALQGALAAHARHVPAMGAPTIAALAELRVRQGRLPEAEQLLAGREVHPSSLRALAQLRIAEGRPQVAAALLERGLAAAGDDAMRVTQLLAPLVDARLAVRRRRGRAGRRDRAGRARAQLARSRSSPRARTSPPRAWRWPPGRRRRHRPGEPRARARSAGCDAARRRRGAARARARARDRRAGARARRRARGVRGVSGARRVAGDGRRGGGAARPRRRDRAARPRLRRAHRARAGGARAARARACRTRGSRRRSSSARRPPATTSAASSPSSACATAPRPPRTPRAPRRPDAALAARGANREFARCAGGRAARKLHP